MKRRTTRVLCAAFAALAAVASPAWGTTQEFTNYCRVGTIRTCASVRVITVWDPVAKVTRVQLWIRNLQGSHPTDNTGGGGITRFGLVGPNIQNPSNLTVTTTGSAGATGDPGQYWAVTGRSIEGPVTFSTSTPGANGGIQGCNPYPSNAQSFFQTCGGDGWVIFSFTTTNQWDASDAQVAWKVYAVAADGEMYYACRTNNDPAWGEFCQAVDPTVTPEPASLALLSSGLAGFAAFARRRRKRAEEAGSN